MNTFFILASTITRCISIPTFASLFGIPIGIFSSAIGWKIYKSIFAKVYVSNWSDKVFVIKNVKNSVLWTYVIRDFSRKEIVETFVGTKKNHKKQIQKNSELKKQWREKVINYMLNGKAMIAVLIIWLIKKDNINE